VILKPSDKNTKNDLIIRIYQILFFLGNIIWSLTIFLRSTTLNENEVSRAILGRTPNFGAVWAGIGLPYIVFPLIFKKEFNPKYNYYLVAIVMVIIVISEVIHHFFLNSKFDIWDMIVSMIASLLFIVIPLVIKPEK